MELSLRSAAASIIKRHKAEHVDFGADHREGFSRCFGFVLGNRNTKKTTFPSTSAQAAAGSLTNPEDVALHQHSVRAGGVSMATAHSVMTTEEPPDGAWNTPTSCLASRSGSPCRSYNPAPPPPSTPPTVQGRAPNSSLVWLMLGFAQRGNNGQKHERSDTQPDETQNKHK